MAPRGGRPRALGIRPVPEPDARLVPLADRLREVELPNPRGPRPLPPPTLSPVERTDPASVKLYMLRRGGGATETS